MRKPFKQFYKKSIKERHQALKTLNIDMKAYEAPTNPELFDHIIENFMTTYEVGMGLVPNVLIDDTYYHVPLATEEPSVIAGLNHACRIFERNGGVKILEIKKELIGQIILQNVTHLHEIENYLSNHKTTLFDIAKKAHPSIHELGGGLKSYHLEAKKDGFACLYIHVDTKDAMGANTINTILEALADHLRNTLGVDVLMSILSNLSTHAYVKAQVTLDPKTIKNGLTGIQKIANASYYAELDPYRATTHNKGIMNGVSALMLATGNDTRAVESSCHSFASLSGTYQPLATWHIKDAQLVGYITLPIQVGIVGGSMGVLPKVKLAHQILQITSALDLMKIAAAVGLAQNFAALYALTTDGINKGHMRLHARNIALQAGATKHQVDAVVHYLIEHNNFHLEFARKYIETLNT